MKSVRNEQGFATNVVLIIVVLILVAGAGVYVAKHKSSPKSAATITTSSQSKPAATSSDTSTAKSSDSSTAASVSFDQSIRKQNLDSAIRGLLSKNAAATANKTQVVYAEITGDTVEDAVVTLKGDGTGGYADVAVFTMQNGSLKNLWMLPDSDKLAYTRAGVGDNQSVLIIGASEYNGAGTQIDTTNNYKWNGTTFAK